MLSNGFQFAMPGRLDVGQSRRAEPRLSVQGQIRQGAARVGATPSWRARRAEAAREPVAARSAACRDSSDETGSFCQANRKLIRGGRGRAWRDADRIYFIALFAYFRLFPWGRAGCAGATRYNCGFSARSRRRSGQAGAGRATP
ncbi:hypothetical protein [Burkholderia sp. Ac-20379]|uniref:hypothetical protein n=1 Tax=Burkholderia sp. Ac-20379 TaxID=2703900 RepID=UPI0019809023|nr:hypothetical protein [Burkholderia sp. Ac-20379]MBN3725436.1 hypothetical protein [Burkholderia sp. Ac-20379]